jgi:hypothetical protein
MRKTGRNKRKTRARESKAFTFSAMLINEKTVHGRFEEPAARELIDTIQTNSGITLSPGAVEKSVFFLTA